MPEPRRSLLARIPRHLYLRWSLVDTGPVLVSLSGTDGDAQIVVRESPVPVLANGWGQMVKPRWREYEERTPVLLRRVSFGPPRDDWMIARIPEPRVGDFMAALLDIAHDPRPEPPPWMHGAEATLTPFPEHVTRGRDDAVRRWLDDGWRDLPDLLRRADTLALAARR